MIRARARLSPRQRRKRDARLRRILDAGLDLVLDGGLDALTIHRLAEVLDYSPGALYRYFPSMEAILVALQGRVIQTLRAHIDVGLELCAEAVAERAVAKKVVALFRLQVVADLYRGLARHRPGHYALIGLSVADPRHLVEDSDTAGVVMEPVMELLGTVAGLLEGAVEAGALAPGRATDRAIILWSGLQGVVQLGKLQRFASDTVCVDRLVDELTHGLLAGWGAETADLAEAAALVADVCRDRPLVELVLERFEKAPRIPAGGGIRN